VASAALLARPTFSSGIAPSDTAAGGILAAARKPLPAESLGIRGSTLWAEGGEPVCFPLIIHFSYDADRSF